MGFNIANKIEVEIINKQIAEIQLKLQSDSRNLDLQQKLKSLKKKIGIIKDEIRSGFKILKSNGQKNEAINVLNDACNIFPEDMNFHKSLVSLLIEGLKNNPKDKNVETKVKTLLTLLENKLPNDLDINTKWIAYYKIYNSYSEIEKHLRRVLKVHPDDYIANLHLANILEKSQSSPNYLENLEEALNILRRILNTALADKEKTDINNIIILKNNLAGILIKICNKKKNNSKVAIDDPFLNEAHSILLEIYHKDPKNIFTISNLAIVSRLFNDLPAEAFYLKAKRKLDHHDLGVQMRLHKVLQLLNDNNEEKKYEPPLPLDFFIMDNEVPKSFFESLYNRLLEVLNNEDGIDKQTLVEILELMLTDDMITFNLKKKITEMIKIASSNKPKEMIALKSLARNLTGNL